MAALEAVYHVYLDQSKEFRISCTPENLEELITGRLYTENRISGPEEIEEIIVREQEEEIHVKTAKKAGESQPQNYGQKKPYDGDPLTLWLRQIKFLKSRESFLEKQAAPIAALYGRMGRFFVALKILAVIMLWIRQ